MPDLRRIAVPSAKEKEGKSSYFGRKKELRE